jgi:hypothetical protein
MSGLYQAFHAWLPSFRPSGTKVSFLIYDTHAQPPEGRLHGLADFCLRMSKRKQKVLKKKH